MIVVGNLENANCTDYQFKGSHLGIGHHQANLTNVFKRQRWRIGDIATTKHRYKL